MLNNRNFRQKLQFLSKIAVFIKNRSFGQKILKFNFLDFLEQYQNFAITVVSILYQKIDFTIRYFSTNIVILAKSVIFDQYCDCLIKIVKLFSVILKMFIFFDVLEMCNF